MARKYGSAIARPAWWGARLIRTGSFSVPPRRTSKGPDRGRPPSPLFLACSLSWDAECEKTVARPLHSRHYVYIMRAEIGFSPRFAVDPTCMRSMLHYQLSHQFGELWPSPERVSTG